MLDVKNLPVAERWRRLAWLAAGYLVLTVIARMTFWHFGYRLFTRAREKIIFGLSAKFFRHVNQLCLRFHGTHSSGELFSYLFGSPLNAVMQFFQHATMGLPSAIVFVLMTIVLFWQWDGALAVLLMGAASMSVHMMLRSRQNVELIQTDFQALEGNISGQVADLLRGNKAVKLYAMESQVVRDFEQQAGVISRKTYERDIHSHQEWMKQ